MVLELEKSALKPELFRKQFWLTKNIFLVNKKYKFQRVLITIGQFKIDIETHSKEVFIIIKVVQLVSRKDYPKLSWCDDRPAIRGNTTRVLWCDSDLVTIVSKWTAMWPSDVSFKPKWLSSRPPSSSKA